MERLTFDDQGCISIKECRNDTCEETCRKVDGCEACPINRAIEKLADYEDLEENGLLIRLPCKIGDKIYRRWNICGKIEVEEFKVTRFCLYDGVWFVEAFGDGPIRDFAFDSFGKTVFLTREEAENNM